MPERGQDRRRPEEDSLGHRGDAREHRNRVEDGPVEDDVLARPDRVEPELFGRLEVLGRPPDAATGDADLGHLPRGLLSRDAVVGDLLGVDLDPEPRLVVRQQRAVGIGERLRDDVVGEVAACGRGRSSRPRVR